MTSKTIKTLRARAFRAQAGRCYYCDKPMWLLTPDELGLRPKSSRPWQCTAEHLIPQQDGGRNTPNNIVAAHAICNQRRHKRPGAAPNADFYLQRVRHQVGKGKWLSMPAAK